MDWETVIGLEVHVQLRTRSKVFSRSPCVYGEEPNRALDAVVMGLPGALPVLNWEAICQTVRAGLIFRCTIAELCRWDRKNYFYPDSPKNYQITQQAQPICIGGQVEIELPGPARNIQGEHRHIRLNRIHLEEDVGKLTHSGDHSLVDFNRAGTPLAEIVSEPDLRSPVEVAAYLNSLRMHLECAAISDCDMEKGQMRCDVNISLRPRGAEEYGTRVEYKNLNSVSGARNATAHEIDRQRRILESGGEVLRETRRWNAQRNTSEALRSKELVKDYCYFPEPDLMPVRLGRELLRELESALPERPFDRQRRFLADYSLPFTLTSVLCPSRALCDYFEAAVRIHPNPQAIANLIANDLLRELPVAEVALRVSPGDLARLVQLVDGGNFSKQVAQDLLATMCRGGKKLEEAMGAGGLTGAVPHAADCRDACRRAIAANPKAAGEFQKGKDNAINALKGAVMRESSGRANPADVDRILRELLHCS
jgi:aspartyl-tRNA(Asn)/glutamyl-tRNA(Gln) amidotransferase subunit B